MLGRKIAGVFHRSLRFVGNNRAGHGGRTVVIAVVAPRIAAVVVILNNAVAFIFGPLAQSTFATLER